MKTQPHINNTTQHIQKMVCQMEILKFKFACENVKYIFSDWEIDVLSLNKNGYITEFEIKVSRSDFKADAKKKKWQWYVNKVEKLTPNYFYYVCNDGLILPDEIPSFAGLMYATTHSLKVVKKAPILHKYKHNYVSILQKMCRVLSERKYLGSCRLTYENNKRTATNKTVCSKCVYYLTCKIATRDKAICHLYDDQP